MITVPKDARKKLEVKAGEYVLFYEEDDKVVIKRG
jgi:AbrB family looped-hinge helix DNA binding protein